MREMKDSGIEWVGKIPAEWEVEKNKRLFFEVNNKCLATDSYTLLSVSEYYGVAPRTEKIKDGDFETRAESLDGYKICQKNDIVMNIMLAWKRATARTSYNGIVSPAYCVYRGKDIETRYYHYVFRTEGCADYFKRHSTGIIDSRLRLYPESFFNLNSPVPPIIEQKQIADFLDNRCSEIDAISADIQKEIETLEQYKRSVITEAVTKGLNPDVEMKDSGIEWVGNIPAHWDVQKNKRLFAEVNNKCLATDNYTLLSVSEYYGVAPRNEKIKDGDFETRAESLDGYKICRKGDIVMNIMLAWKKATARTAYDGIVSPAYCVYRGKGIETRYYHYVFRTNGCADYFRLHSTGIIDSRLRLYTDAFFNLNSPVPPIDEQKNIATYLDSKCEEIESIIAIKKKQMETLGSYKKSLIYEYVTGKKEVPTYES